MDDVKYLRTTQIMIFPVDDINLAGVRREETLQTLNAKYRLQVVRLPDALPGLLNAVVLRNGEYEHGAKKYLIDEIVLEDRRIVINMQSHSDICDDFFMDFRKELLTKTVGSYSSRLEPIITTYETHCVSRLNFDLAAMMRPEILDGLAASIRQNINSHEAKSTIIPFSFRVKLSFFDIPEQLRTRNVTLADKFLTIEYREKTDPKERMYFTASPCDTDAHMKILMDLEKSLSR